MATIDKYILNVQVIGQKAVDTLNNSVNGLGAALAQVGFGAFIANSFKMADALIDVADSANLSAGSVLALANGLEEAGGKYDSVDKIVNTFYRTLEDMASGADSAEEALGKLNITFDDLRTLSEQQLLNKAIEQLAKMDAGARRTALGVQIFGKSFANVDPAVLDRVLQTRNVEALTKSLENAAKVVGDIEASYRKLQETTVTVFTSLLGGTDSLKISSEQALTVIELLLKVWAGQLFVQAISAIFTLERAIRGLATALGVSLGLASALGVAFRALAIPLAIGTAVYGFFKLGDAIEDAGLKLNQTNLDIENLGPISEQAAKKINDAYAASIQGLQLSLQAGKITLEEFQKEVEKADALRKNNLGITDNKPGAFPDADPFTEQERESRLRAVAAAKIQTAALQEQFNLNVRNLRVINETIGMDEDRAELIRNISQIATDFDGKRLDLQTKINEELAKGKDTNQGLVEQYRKQLEALDEQQSATIVLKAEELSRGLAVKQTTVELEKQIGLINAALEGVKSQIEVNKLLAIARGELSEDEAEYQAQRQTLQAESDARIAELEAALKNEINDINKEKIRNEIDTERARTQAVLDGLEKRREAEEQARESVAAGVRKTMEEIGESIAPAKIAANALQSAFQSVDDALTNFVKKGTFNLKEFVRNLLADLALAIARMLVFRAILAVLAPFSPAAAAGLQAALPFGGARAQGGDVRPGMAYLVGEKGPELAMFDRPGTIIPNNMLSGGGGQTTVNYNINAVDAASFRSMVARDPQFIYNVTEVGRRSQPSRRLA